MTATPIREDGLEQKVFMQLGPVRYRLTAKDRAAMQDFSHYVYPRFTSLVDTSEKNWSINEAYRELISNVRRNKLIVSDVINCIENDRTPVVLTKFKEHAEILLQMLETEVRHVFLLQGENQTKSGIGLLRN